MDRGLSLLGVLIAMALVSMLSIGVMRLINQGFLAQRRLASESDRINVRQLIASQIDCSGTFETAGIDPADPDGNCNSTSNSGGQVGPFLRLRRKTRSGGTHFLTGPLDGDGKVRFGKNYFIRASCSEAEQSLVIRISEVSSDGSFDAPRSLLFGTSGTAFPICFEEIADADVFTLVGVTTFVYPGGDANGTLGTRTFTSTSGNRIVIQTTTTCTANLNSGVSLVVTLTGTAYSRTHQYVGATSSASGGSSAASSSYSTQPLGITPNTDYPIVLSVIKNGTGVGTNRCHTVVLTVYEYRMS